jgi:hypothetical protein
MSRQNEIPADWWVAQDSDAAWQRQMEQSRYEAQEDAMRRFGRELNERWEQMELPLDEPPQPRPVNPF